MSRSVHLTWDESFTAYDFGPFHPMAPIRVDLTIRLARELGLLSRPNVSVRDAKVAGDDLLGLVHEAGYIQAVRRVSADPLHPDEARGLGTEDTPAFPGMHEASARVVGATVACAEAVWTGAADHGVNIAGGLHHAMPGAASGFCVYNDVSVAIAWLLANGAERVAYVDVDVHHGDGVERAFWDDDRVLTISIHETGRTLFPGSGWPEDTGGPRAKGSAVNLALPAGTGDSGWLRAFHAIVPPLLEEFRPQVLVTQSGCDSHFLDPLGHLTLSVDAQRESYAALHALAHRHTEGRWIATGGGGYEIVDVVPRAWTHLIAVAAGAPLDPTTEIPSAWRDHISALLGRTAPQRMTDGRAPSWRDLTEGYDPADPVDRAINATRNAAFPTHGILFDL